VPVKGLSERNPFTVGLVAAVVIVVAVLATLSFGALGLGQHRYTAEFAQSGDLRVGDEVRVAGLEVGEVTGVGLEGDHVLARFRVRRDVPLGADTGASIKLTTLLGGRYLELRPAGAGELPGDRIPLSHTQVPYDLQKVLQTGTPLLEDLNGTAFRDALRVTAGTFRGDGPKIAAALDGLSRMSKVIENRRDQITHLIDGAGQVTELVDRRGERLFGLLDRSDTLLAELTRRRELIRSVLTDLAGVTGQLRRTLAENESQIGPLLDNAKELTELLEQEDESVDRALELLAPAGRYLTNALGNGPYLELYLPYSIIPDNVLCRAGAVDGCAR
jgi:phospholipid/cholesterol/gamma-HCH transport system substrate-binding protein